MLLDELMPHPSPKPSMEQYTLLGDDAAHFLWLARRDLEGSVVVDLGCGSGRLAIGAVILGASFAIGVDVDLEALRAARVNAARAGVERSTSWVHARVPELSLRADVVIQNPPFGVQRRGADRAFIECSLRIAPVVYSMHKSVEGSRAFISRLVESLGGRAEVLGTMDIRLPATFNYHVKRFKKVRVDIYRFTKP